MRHFRRSALLLVVLGVSLARPSPADAPVPLDALFDRGVQALKAGRLDEAETVFRRVLQPGGNRAYVHNNLAIVHQEQGKYAEAVAECRAAIRLDPAYVPPRVVLGGSLLALGRAYLRVSEWAMQRLREIDPGSARIYQALGHTYRVQGRADLAVRAFERAAQADPKLPEIHLALAQIHLEQKNYGEARKEIDRELALVPESAGARALKQRLEAVEDR